MQSVIDYRPSHGGGLDYHNSPLIGEIPATDLYHMHRSIDQLRSLNERGTLNHIAVATSMHNTDLKSTSSSAAAATASVAQLEYKLYLNNNNNNNNNNTSGGIGGVSIGATNISNSILAATATNTAIAYRDGQFFEQNCHMDAGSPNGSLASASPPSVIGAHSVNHVSNYRPHMAYYQA